MMMSFYIVNETPSGSMLRSTFFIGVRLKVAVTCCDSSMASALNMNDMRVWRSTSCMTSRKGSSLNLCVTCCALAMLNGQHSKAVRAADKMCSCKVILVLAYRYVTVVAACLV